MVWVEVELLGAAVRPERDLILVGVATLLAKSAFDFFDFALDANLLPLLDDHLSVLSVGQERSGETHQLDAQTAFAVCPQPVAIGILCVQSSLVQDLVGLLRI